VVSAPEQKCRLALVLKEDRRGVAVVVLGRGRVVAFLEPALLTRLLVEPRDPRFAVMHPGHDNTVLGNHRRAARVPK